MGGFCGKEIVVEVLEFGIDCFVLVYCFDLVDCGYLVVVVELCLIFVVNVDEFVVVVVESRGEVGCGLCGYF